MKGKSVFMAFDAQVLAAAVLTKRRMLHTQAYTQTHTWFNAQRCSSEPIYNERGKQPEYK